MLRSLHTTFSCLILFSLLSCIVAVTLPDATVEVATIVARAAASESSEAKASATTAGKAAKSAAPSMLEGSMAGQKVYFIVIIVLSVLLALILGYILYWRCMGDGEEYSEWKKSQKDDKPMKKSGKPKNGVTTSLMGSPHIGAGLPSPAISKTSF